MRNRMDRRGWTDGQGGSMDRGPAPYAVNVSEAARENTAFRTALWTGRYLQMTVMSIPPRCDIGMELHEDTDQLIRVEAGQALVKMGACRERLDLQKSLSVNDAVFVPAGFWHNVINIGGCPLKVSSVYAPPHHKRGTCQQTKEDALE